MNNVIKYLINSFVVLLVVAQAIFFAYGIFTDFKLINEFKNIDEETLVGDKFVKNSEYIKQNLIFEPLKSSMYQYNSYNDIVSKCKSISSGCKYIVIHGDAHNSQFATLYNRDYNITMFDALINPSSNSSANAIVNTLMNYNDRVKEQDTGAWDAYPLFWAKSLDKLQEKVDFIANNLYEQQTQLINRYFWHEAPFMLNAINELNLGRDKSEIFSQYGFLSAYTVKFIMQSLGGINVENFDKAKNIINLTYYIISIAFIILFTKNYFIRFIFIILFSIYFFSIGFHSYHFAPTHVYIRHFFDLLIALMLFWSMKFKELRLYYVAIVFTSGILSILLVKDFGLFLFLSIVGTFIIKYVLEFIERRRVDLKELWIFIIFILFSIIACIKYPLMDNPSTKYFLDGFYSLPISMPIYMLLLFAISLLWLGLIWFYVELKRSNFLLSYIFLLFYTEFLCILFVWKGNFDNINFAIIALPMLILFHFIVKRIRNILYIIIAPILIFAYAKYCYEYISQMTLYENTFATHRNYKWDHERAGGIITTYSFERFDDALRLINKYSKNSNELYMISKYDNMLQFFSKKYSGLKYFELKSFIVTDNEYNEVLDLINSKADILYVDTDIFNVYYKELKERRFFDVYNNQWLPNDVMRRIIQLKILLNLFDDVRDKYELIEHGKLIDVYKKKKE